MTKVLTKGWSRGYERRLMFERLWVWLLALCTGWAWHFFTLICCKTCNVCLKRQKMNEKRPGLAHFLKKVLTKTFSLFQNYPPMDVHIILNKASSLSHRKLWWSDFREMTWYLICILDVEKGLSLSLSLSLSLYLNGAHNDITRNLVIYIDSDKHYLRNKLFYYSNFWGNLSIDFAKDLNTRRTDDLRLLNPLKMAIPCLFFFIFVFSIQLTVSKCSIQKFTDDWIQTAAVWCRKQQLYQLSHNHCPGLSVWPDWAIYWTLRNFF